MSILRFDVTTGDWLAYSSSRAHRPDGFGRVALSAPPAVAREPHCPFCPGNEALTPATIDVDPHPDDAESWCVRIVANKYPVLEPSASTLRRLAGPLFREMDGHGRHELVIETERHDLALPDQSPEHVLRLLRVLHRRSQALSRDPTLEVVQIFKNHGAVAGSSMPHPHFQILATPVLPREIRLKHETAAEYYNVAGVSVYTDLCRAELEVGTRIVSINDEFVAFAPYASRVPYETWILPRKAAPTFESADVMSLPLLAEILKQVLGRMKRALNDPPYNLVVNSAPRRHADEPDFVWHIEVLPRLTTTAGFELATGMAINTVLPEQAAEVLRATAPI
ncbi:MAG TPA: galactose-1-phosphate uridylyltransferase [Polyangiaceae bacterium]|nr:galactose-1-phosphate uridylyltransferase [Polyangiaceae bacterium]